MRTGLLCSAISFGLVTTATADDCIPYLGHHHELAYATVTSVQQATRKEGPFWKRVIWNEFLIDARVLRSAFPESKAKLPANIRVRGDDRENGVCDVPDQKPRIGETIAVGLLRTAKGWKPQGYDDIATCREVGGCPK